MFWNGPTRGFLRDAPRRCAGKKRCVDHTRVVLLLLRSFMFATVRESERFTRGANTRFSVQSAGIGPEFGGVTPGPRAADAAVTAWPRPTVRRESHQYLAEDKRMRIRGCVLRN